MNLYPEIHSTPLALWYESRKSALELPITRLQPSTSYWAVTVYESLEFFNFRPRNNRSFLLIQVGWLM